MLSKRHFSHRVYFALFSRHILKCAPMTSLSQDIFPNKSVISSRLMIILMLICIKIDEENHENNRNY